MYSSRPNIYKMLDTLSLEMKVELLEYLKADIATATATPLKFYLEEQWAEIMRLIEILEYEPYIDDQMEIEEIRHICEEMIKSGRLKKEPWLIRRRVIEGIIDGEYYDYYGVCDPMEDLFHALMFTEEEKTEIADLIFAIGSEYMLADGAKLYKEVGQQEKYIAYIERHLKDKQEPYLDTIDYYKDRDPKRAVEIAELGLKRCKDDQTDLIIFLIRDARINGDKTRESRFLKSAKVRKAVNLSRMLEALDTAS